MGALRRMASGGPVLPKSDGAGTLFSMYSGDLGADFVLAIVSCLT
jgi:hypothetical protein